MRRPLRVSHLHEVSGRPASEIEIAPPVPREAHPPSPAIHRSAVCPLVPRQNPAGSSGSRNSKTRAREASVLDWQPRTNASETTVRFGTGTTRHDPSSTTAGVNEPSSHRSPPLPGRNTSRTSTDGSAHRRLLCRDRHRLSCPKKRLLDTTEHREESLGHGRFRFWGRKACSLPPATSPAPYPARVYPLRTASLPLPPQERRARMLTSRAKTKSRWLDVLPVRITAL